MLNPSHAKGTRTFDNYVRDPVRDIDRPEEISSVVRVPPSAAKGNKEETMSANQWPPPQAADASGREKTYFEQQREALIGDIAMSFEHVLANVNKLNRSLEAVIAVGNEFSSVEALWSQFENVMAKEPEDGKAAQDQNEGGGGAEERERENAGSRASC
ncbi:uncharacterized protein E0L32_007362 [Thyridium curvatum]|uniref:DASH complex subunit DAD1 n=1 Tax=Thyridium curvatum TaxID=1093900 RepID=A0A507AZJ5_9PEZI|nr:uncharacterized protein E0L32_007362 [Thyridium curvatum]TPX11864.1 hypothetical protein E0L32_007362 [Thyridium curvatum]